MHDGGDPRLPPVSEQSTEGRKGDLGCQPSYQLVTKKVGTFLEWKTDSQIVRIYM